MSSACLFDGAELLVNSSGPDRAVYAARTGELFAATKYGNVFAFIADRSGVGRWHFVIGFELLTGTPDVRHANRMARHLARLCGR